MASLARREGPTLDAVATYHNDTVDSLRRFLRFSDQQGNPRFLGFTITDFDRLFLAHARETELRSCLVLLASVEAVFRIDFASRVLERAKDPLSRQFRQLYKEKKKRVSLDKDILQLWSENHPDLKQIVRELRSALRFRHWLAHGRHWDRPANGKFDFPSLFDLTFSILENFPLQRVQ